MKIVSPRVQRTESPPLLVHTVNRKPEEQSIIANVDIPDSTVEP